MRDRPSIRCCIQLAFTLGFIHTHFSHRDGAASASAHSQRGAHTLSRGTHGCESEANIFHVRLDNNTRLKFQDQDLSSKRRWVRRVESSEQRDAFTALHVFFSSPLRRGLETPRRALRARPRMVKESRTKCAWNCQESWILKGIFFFFPVGICGGVVHLPLPP